MPKTVNLSDMTLNMLSEGYVGRMIEAELLRIATDMEQREDGQARKLKIELVFKSKNNGRIGVTPRVQAVLPPQQSHETTAILVHDEKARKMVLRFNPDAINPDQATVNDVVEA